MIPALIKKYKTSNGVEISLFNTGFMSTTYKLRHFDMENSDIKGLIRSLESFCDNLPEGVVVKFSSSTGRSFGDVSEKCFRNEAMRYLGWTTHSLVVRFEKQAPGFKAQLFSLFKNKLKDSYLDESFAKFAGEINLSGLKSIGFSPEPISTEDFLKDSYIKKVDGGLRVDNSYLSIIKLKSLGNYESTIENLAMVREKLREPYEIVFSIKKIDEKASQLLLNSKSKREESGRDLKSHKKYVETQKALEEIDNQGKKVFEIEFTVLIWSLNESLMRSSAQKAKEDLNKIAEFVIEDWGALPSLCSTLPGGKIHVKNLEITDRVTSFFPIYINGQEVLKETTSRSFLFHRSDDTVDSVDIFSPSQNNFSGIVIGTSGRGKSVFVNNLIQSLNHDPDLRIILVDVKGSYTNTVKNLGGDVFPIDTSQSSTISPFNFLHHNKSMDIIEIIADFIEKLVLEDHEKSLLRSEQAGIEERLVKYVKLNPSNPSIDDFCRKIENIPRKDSLKRWIKGGVYESVFSVYSDQNQAKIQYFDFANIVTAQKGGVNAAIMSAIMAHFNFSLLSKKTKEKLVFIADETPFFVQSCFSSFSLLMKNVRKLNGSLILIAQNLSDLVIDGDSSLVSQPELKVFFSQEETSLFENLCGLRSDSIAKLCNFETFNGKYAQFLIKTNDGEREGVLRLSKDEYFRATTLSEDREKIESLTSLFNLENENQAIEILADIGSRYENIV